MARPARQASSSRRWSSSRCCEIAERAASGDAGGRKRRRALAPGIGRALETQNARLAKPETRRSDDPASPNRGRAADPRQRYGCTAQAHAAPDPSVYYDRSCGRDPSPVDAYLARPFGALPARVGPSSAAPPRCRGFLGRSFRNWYNPAKRRRPSPSRLSMARHCRRFSPSRCQSARFGNGGSVASDITVGVGDGAPGSEEVSHGTDPRPRDSVSSGTDPLTAIATQTLSQAVEMLRQDVERERDRADRAEGRTQQTDRRTTGLTRGRATAD